MIQILIWVLFIHALTKQISGHLQISTDIHTSYMMTMMMIRQMTGMVLKRRNYKKANYEKSQNGKVSPKVTQI
jgi:hypothetical protein